MPSFFVEFTLDGFTFISHVILSWNSTYVRFSGGQPPSNLPDLAVLTLINKAVSYSLRQNALGPDVTLIGIKT